MRYVVRKLEQHWTICVGGTRVIACEDLEEAFLIARSAASILSAARPPAASAQSAASSPDGARCEARRGSGVST
jgi:hypothetical protein